MASPPALGEQDAEPKPERSGSPTIKLVLVVTPVVGADVVQRLADEVTRELKARYPEVGWKVTGVHEALVEPPAALADVVDAARARLLTEERDVVVHVTELPIRIFRRPVLSHSSRTHGAAVISLPALPVAEFLNHAERSRSGIGAAVTRSTFGLTRRRSVTMRIAP